MAKTLMKGNEALAESALRAGCRFFSGYPITPQTEILEYMSWRMREVGGEFVQTESEVAGINMLFGASAAGARALTSSSGPGFSLKQEGISYLCGTELPAVIVDVMRIGSALGNVFQGQGDYWQLTRGGGHGDYRTIVLAPASVQENADMAYEAFDLAEKYTHPVLIASDAAIGQMVEAVELKDFHDHDINKYDWVIKGRKEGEDKRIAENVYYAMGADEYKDFLLEKYKRIEDNEQKWESVNTEDAEVVLVSYGISSRVCKEAVKIARKKGIKLGLIRLKTLWPFPKKAFDALTSDIAGFLCVEMSILGQMVDDVKLATDNKFPVKCYSEFSNVPDPAIIIERAEKMLLENGGRK
ncbi:MAG: 3-methyl-2-oxobutanoate dehydrogenase subunit VorB [Eubacteriaceae bacterium]|jgi:2-oxoglutarate ferredoxin oxidoreductase subunit alpha|nr:3-methyl-2-oxobutanoate dehydrogenase subunit VorB [Eubacteriaceae bacterium]